MDQTTSRRLTILFCVTLLGAGFLARLVIAGKESHPGHADHAFYYTVAENLAGGRGLVTDYVWNFLGHPESIPAPSYDYWMPLTSIIISLSFVAFGTHLFAALIPSILFGLCLALVTYHIGKIFFDSSFDAACAASLVLFAPSLFVASLRTDSPVYYALFVSLSLLFVIKGWTHARYFLFAAVAAGLAHLTRQDGVLLLPVLFIMILVSPARRGQKILTAGLALTVYGLVLSPLLALNIRSFGAPFPPGPAKTMFLTQYEDLYSCVKELSFQSYLDWGIANIMASKWNAAVGNGLALIRALGGVLSIFLVVGVVDVFLSREARRKWMVYLPPFMFLLFLFCFYTVFATLPGTVGGFIRSGIAAIPFLVVVAVHGLIRTLLKTAVSRRFIVVIIALISALFFFRSLQAAHSMLRTHAKIDREMTQLKELISRDAHQREKDKEIVVMTRIPWEVYHSTRFRAVQIPNETLEPILGIAEKFGANYLLLPAPRAAFEELYKNEWSDPRFLFIDRVGTSQYKLYRIILAESK